MTTTIVDGIKQFIIERFDPSDFSDDLLEGLRIKEDMIKMQTPCFLRETIPDFDKLEELVHNTLGSKYNDVLLGRATEENTQIILPTLELSGVCPCPGTSSSSSGCGGVASGNESICHLSLFGGNIKLDRFDDWQWNIIQSPSQSSVQIDEYLDYNDENQIDNHYLMTFSHPGFYMMSMKITDKYTSIFVTETLMVEVV